MMDKIKAVWAVFKTGEMVANPTAWKKKQVTSGILAAFLSAVVALIKALGYDIPLTDDQLLQIGGAVIAVLGLFNGVATVVSTDKLGLQPRADGKSDTIVQVDSSVLERVPAVPAPAPTPLQPERHAEAGAWLAEPSAEPEKPLRTFDQPAERANTSFAGGG